MGERRGRGSAFQPTPEIFFFFKFLEREAFFSPPHIRFRKKKVKGDASDNWVKARFLFGKTGRAPRLRGGSGHCLRNLSLGVLGAPGLPREEKGRSQGSPCPVGWPTPADSAMWLNRSHKMPASDMAAAPLLPRPAEELKMAASRKCGAERNARQRRKRRPSGNAARAGTPPPVAVDSSSFSFSRYIILLP